MKQPAISFMRLEGTPASARYIPIPVLFSPLFLLQGVGVLFAASRLVEKTVLLLHTNAGQGQYFTYPEKVSNCLAFMHHGSRKNFCAESASRERSASCFSAVDIEYSIVFGA